MFRYRLHSPDGDDLGEATYAQVIHEDDEIIASGNQRFRVVHVVAFRGSRRLGVRGDAQGRGSGLGFRVANPPVPDESDKQALAEQLARTGADVRALGEQLGAIAPGEAKEYSLRRARITLVGARNTERRRFTVLLRRPHPRTRGRFRQPGNRSRRWKPEPSRFRRSPVLLRRTPSARERSFR